MIDEIPNEYGLCPDVRCSFNGLERLFEKEDLFFVAEHVHNNCPGRVIYFDKASCRDDFKYEVIAGGRYFPKEHFRSSLDQLSCKIKSNKNKNSRLYKKFNKQFYDVFKYLVSIITQRYITKPYLCLVPPKINKDPVLNDVILKLSKELKLMDISRNLVCEKYYPDNKKSSSQERRDNVNGAFTYTGELNGADVILIDDIYTTGATVEECMHELLKHGARKIIVVTLAVTQKAMALCCDANVLKLIQNYTIRFNSETLKPFFKNTCTEATKKYWSFMNKINQDLTQWILRLNLGNDEESFFR